MASPMWESIIAKLKAIEDNLLRQDEYVDKFDAMSLASVVTSSDSIDSALTFVPTVKLASLSKLTNDILLVLHEAYIDQQGALIVIKIDIDKCRNFADSSDSQRHENEAKSWSDSCPSSGHAIELEAPSLEGITFPTDKQISSKTSRKRYVSETEAMHRRFRSLQLEIHGNLTAILNAKLVAYEVITSSFDIYLKFIVKTAYENGVLDPLRRAIHLVQPLLTNLLAHKFLDTGEVCSLILDCLRFMMFLLLIL